MHQKFCSRIPLIKAEQDAPAASWGVTIQCRCYRRFTDFNRRWRSDIQGLGSCVRRPIVDDTSAYIGTGLGPGPRDGLMTGLAARTGWPIGGVRTGIELTVLALGWICGGTVGVGTILYAVAIGPIVHATLPFFTIAAKSEDGDPEAAPDPT